MAISLNSVNTRVTALENKSSNSFYGLDFSKYVNLGTITSYTVPSNGFIFAGCLIGDVNLIAEVKVNGYPVVSFYSFSGNWAGTGMNWMVPVSKNDKLTISRSLSSLASSGRYTFRFIPAKTLYYKVLESINRFFKEVIS